MTTSFVAVLVAATCLVSAMATVAVMARNLARRAEEALFAAEARAAADRRRAEVALAETRRWFMLSSVRIAVECYVDAVYWMTLAVDGGGDGGLCEAMRTADGRFGYDSQEAVEEAETRLILEVRRVFCFQFRSDAVLEALMHIVTAQMGGNPLESPYKEVQKSWDRISYGIATTAVTVEPAPAA